MQVLCQAELQPLEGVQCTNGTNAVGDRLGPVLRQRCGSGAP